jgi:hypothetical protein
MSSNSSSIPTMHTNFETAPEFAQYRRLGEYRVLRCDFPHLMGWSQLRRPIGLPRSFKTPYFTGNHSPMSNGMKYSVTFELF